MDFHVVQYTLDGRFVGVVAGLGRNVGTWDSLHSQRTAQRHAAALRRECSNSVYRVEQHGC